MKSEYFVLHKRDFDGEKLTDNNHKRELYDKINRFSSIEDATDFALENMHENPILARSIVEIDEKMVRFKETPYVIAAYFASKYIGTYCFDSSEPFPTYEIIRCSQNQLEATLRSIASERPDKIQWGIELKLIPETGGN